MAGQRRAGPAHPPHPDRRAGPPQWRRRPSVRATPVRPHRNGASRPSARTRPPKHPPAWPANGMTARRRVARRAKPRGHLRPAVGRARQSTRARPWTQRPRSRGVPQRKLCLAARTLPLASTTERRQAIGRHLASPACLPVRPMTYSPNGKPGRKRAGNS